MTASDVVLRAKKMALHAHQGLTRPNRANEPYRVHIEEVACLVLESGGTDEEIAAAWLYDSVEDTSLTLADIEAHCGKEVAEIVDGLTDKPDIKGFPTLERKKLQATRIAGKNDSIKRVKIADQTSNVRSVAEDPPKDWDTVKALDYVEGARLIAEECRGVDSYLTELFDEAYKVAIEARSTSVVFFSEDCLQAPYDPKVHLIFKFLYFERDCESLLIVGDPYLNSHINLWSAYSITGGKFRVSDIRGAGDLYRKKVDRWESTVYEITTPDRLKPHILKLFGTRVQE